jgi:hypothetical protein
MTLRRGVVRETNQTSTNSPGIKKATMPLGHRRQFFAGFVCGLDQAARVDSLHGLFGQCFEVILGLDVGA